MMNKAILPVMIMSNDEINRGLLCSGVQPDSRI